MANESLDAQVDLQSELDIDLDPKVVSESLMGLVDCEEGRAETFESIDDVIKYLKN